MKKLKKTLKGYLILIYFLITIVGNWDKTIWQLWLVFYMYHVILKAYMSKYNHECDDQIILLMITGNEDYWHYLAVNYLDE